MDGLQAIVRALAARAGAPRTPSRTPFKPPRTPPLKACLMPRLSLSELMYLVGLVRELRACAIDVLVIAKKAHADHMRPLYGDVGGVRFQFVDDWRDVRSDELEAQGYAIVPLSSYRSVCPYRAFGLPCALAASGINIQRDMEAERELLHRVWKAVGTAYVVVHDDAARRIEPHLLPASTAVVRVDDPRFATPCVFDWIEALDHALQLHAIDSCFLMLANVLSLRPRKFCHAYADDTASYRPAVYGDAITVWG